MKHILQKAFESGVMEDAKSTCTCTPHKIRRTGFCTFWAAMIYPKFGPWA